MYPNVEIQSTIVNLVKFNVFLRKNKLHALSVIYSWDNYKRHTCMKQSERGKASLLTKISNLGNVKIMERESQ